MNKEGQDNRPNNIPQEAVYECGWWVLKADQHEGIPHGEYLRWFDNGQLSEKRVYDGMDGDSYTEELYTDIGDLIYTKYVEKGIIKLIKRHAYEGKSGDNRAMSFASLSRYNDSVVDENIKLIEQTDFYLNRFDNAKLAIAHTEDGKTITIYDKRDEEKDNYNDAHYSLYSAYSALSANNYSLAEERLKGLTASDFTTYYQTLFFYISINLNHHFHQRVDTQEHIDMCLAICSDWKDLNWWFEIDEQVKKILAEALNKPIEKWAAKKEYKKIQDFFTIMLEKKIWGYSVYESPFNEWGCIVGWNLFPNNANVIQRIYQRIYRLELAQERTSISDCIVEAEGYQKFASFIKSIPQEYTYSEKDKGILTINGDVYWDNDFEVGDLLIYYPQLSKVRNIVINGDFTINGNFKNENPFESVYLLSLKVTGNFSANQIWVYDFNLTVGKQLEAKELIHMQIGHSWKLSISGMINTPLYISLYSLVRHKGGFSDNCTILIDRIDHCVYLKNHKCHLYKDLDSKYLGTREDKLDKSAIHKLIDDVAAGKNIFREGYDPNALPPVNKAEEKMEPIPQLIAKGDMAAASKIIKSITYNELDRNPSIELMYYYYQLHILYLKDKVKHEKSIKGFCETVLKLAKDADSPRPRWDILCFVADFLANIHEQKGAFKKALDLINDYNLGDKAHYERKAKLLIELGKEKEAVLPVYIARHHYGSKLFADFEENKHYKAIIKTREERVVAPKGYKNYVSETDANKFENRYSITLNSDKEEESELIYKGDVYWNGNMNISEDSGHFKQDFFSISILGDLYVDGDITNIGDGYDIYVKGNVFAHNIYMYEDCWISNANVFAEEDLIIAQDRGVGAQSIDISGNVKATVIAADPGEMEILGTIDKKTICIAFNTYEFDNIEVDFHTDDELDEYRGWSCDEVLIDLALCEPKKETLSNKLKNKKLFAKTKK